MIAINRNIECMKNGGGLRVVALAACALIAATWSTCCYAKETPPVPVSSPADAWSYADVADLVLTAPVVLTARVVEAIPVTDGSAGTARSATIRTYVTADVVALIRGSNSGIAPRIAWLADVPVDARGKLPKLKKAQVVIAALPVPGRPGELRLAARDAMIAWSPKFEARVRATLAASLAADTPAVITGIGSAFYSPGNLPGEGESQVFLTTTDARPVSLNIVRRPGQAPRFAVALGEIVDEAARPPARDTLGWYRLACTLPRALPPAAVADLSESDAAAARADYGLALDVLGPCTRVRAAR